MLSGISIYYTWMFYILVIGLSTHFSYNYLTNSHFPTTQAFSFLAAYELWVHLFTLSRQQVAIIVLAVIFY